MNDNRTNERKKSLIKKARSRYLAEIIMDADYPDGQMLLTNKPTKAKYLLPSLEQAARGIGLYMDWDKTDFMSFNQDGAIYTFNKKPLKLD